METCMAKKNEVTFSFDIEKVIKNLSSKRKFFYSESDFQLALAWVIKEIYKDSIDIRMEYCPAFDSSMHIDIVVFIKGNQKWIPIELKYKTKKTEIFDGVNSYELKNHSAKPQNCYKYLRDIERIEKVRAQKSDIFLEGYAIFLTNEISYCDVSGEDCSYQQFAISEGSKRMGEMKGAENTSDGTKRGCEENVNLKGKYTMRWKIFSECETVSGEGGKFIYLINSITNKSK